MNRKNYSMTWLAIAAATMGLGLSMPSCPGQQALQQQVDALQTTNIEMNKKIQALNAQVGTVTGEMNQVKQLLQQMTNAIQEQKGTMAEMDKTIKELQAKNAAPAKNTGRQPVKRRR